MPGIHQGGCLSKNACFYGDLQPNTYPCKTEVGGFMAPSIYPFSLKKRDGRQRERADQTGISRRPMGGIEQPFFIPMGRRRESEAL